MGKGALGDLNIEMKETGGSPEEEGGVNRKLQNLLEARGESIQRGGIVQPPNTAVGSVNSSTKD